MKREKPEIKLYIASVSVAIDYSKSLRLESSPGSQIQVSIKDFGEDYEQYMARILSYYEKDSHTMETKLAIESLVSEGNYIRGLFGGEGKKGKKKYAGLVVESVPQSPNSDIQRIRLFNTSSDLETDKGEYEGHQYKLIYRGITHPFYHTAPYVIVGDKSKKNLISFLKHLIVINGHILGREDREKIEVLLTEVQFPAKLQIFQEKKWYVLFRDNRTFSSVVISPNSDRWITESHMAYLDCGENPEKAFYYSAVLNYLAYKTLKLGMGFVRDQFSRPILAIIDAGLSWNEIKQEIRKEISDLSIKMHDEAKNLFKKISIKQEKKAFDILEKTNTFNTIVNKLDGVTSKSRVSKALTWVAGEPKKQKKSRVSKIQNKIDHQGTLKGV